MNLFSALPYSAELGDLSFSLVELTPELNVFTASRIRGIDEHSVMFADDLVMPVAECVEEVVIRRDDRAIRLELDRRLHFPDGIQQRPIIEIGQPLRGIGPFNDIAIEFAGRFQRCNRKIERSAPDTDVGLVRFFQFRQHLALMIRVLVKAVDAAAHKLVGRKARKLLAQIILGFTEKRSKRGIHIGDVQGCIGDHYIGA